MTDTKIGVLKLKYIKTTLKFLVIGSILFFIINNLYANWEKLKVLDITINVNSFLASLLVLFIAWSIMVLAAQKLFQAFGYKLPYVDIYIIYCKSMIGKYIRGKLWQIAGLAYLATQKGIPKKVAFTASVLGQSYTILSGLIIIGCSFIFNIIPVNGDLLSYFKISSFPIVLMFLIIVVRPSLLELPINGLLGILKKEKITIDIKFRDTIEIFLLYFLCWFIFGLGFWLFANSITNLDFSTYWAMTAILAGSFVIGFLAIFAPGGIGVREGIMVLLMSLLGIFVVPLPSAISLGFRIIMTISEIITIALAYILAYKFSDSKDEYK